jgi:hypothetical protein
MSTIEQIETAILTLAPDEFQRLRQWFVDMDYQRWDRQLEQDVADGKLNALAEEAIAELEDELRPEYDFAAMQGVRGKYVQRYRSGTNLVLLDPDIATAFPTDASVNEEIDY